MKANITLLLASLLTTVSALAQDMAYLTRDSLQIDSEYWGETRIDLALPDAFYTTGNENSIPCVIVLDQQHQYTYQHHLLTFDLMMVNAQMPQSLIVGVPFDYQVRNQRTASRLAEGDSITGAEGTRRFIEDELIPTLKKDYKINDRVIIVGHSRTGWLVNYLLISNPDQYAMGLAASGFFEPGFEATDIRSLVKDWIVKEDSPAWYFTNGISREESSYKAAYDQLEDSLRAMAQPGSIYWRHKEFDYNGRMGNFMMSLAWAFSDYYGSYAMILDDWLYDKQDKVASADASAELIRDFKKLSDEKGMLIKPDIIHLWSIGSYYFYNDGQDGWLEIMQLAHRLYPNDHNFAYELSMTYHLMEDFEKRELWREKALAILAASSHIGEPEKAEYKTAILEIGK
ncbi:alpha/beta hydrolase-fold protein [Sanyastnella coralliicola]|uniref:alpha/beta hydrolase-fold protein n=1 Tax=Sanyastnella coralliicola TaxID=3069118 RepID=UPI0027B8FDBA|nr:alpha/beta hydrolase-fold protein [Longitalea sp. SCSIO 12813]